MIVLAVCSIAFVLNIICVVLFAMEYKKYERNTDLKRVIYFSILAMTQLAIVIANVIEMLS